jgi:hypothetical protein
VAFVHSGSSLHFGERQLVCDGLHLQFTQWNHPMTQTTSGVPAKVRTRYLRAKDGTTLVLNYRHQEAHDIRAALQRIRLKGDKTPSLSLIARRSMRVYLAHLESSPAAFAHEVQALERLATPVANRKDSTPMQ